MIGLTNILSAGNSNSKPIEFRIEEGSWETYQDPQLETNYRAVMVIGCKADDVLQVFFDVDCYKIVRDCYVIANITGANEATFYAKEKPNTYLTGKYVLNGSNGGGAAGPVVGVKGDAETDYRVGRVNITKENLGIYEATETKAGLLSADDKHKLNRICALEYDFTNECIKVPSNIGVYLPDQELIILS